VTVNKAKRVNMLAVQENTREYIILQTFSIARALLLEQDSLFVSGGRIGTGHRIQFTLKGDSL
jgi:hypothetical protein